MYFNIPNNLLRLAIDSNKTLTLRFSQRRCNRYTIIENGLKGTAISRNCHFLDNILGRRTFPRRLLDGKHDFSRQNAFLLDCIRFLQPMGLCGFVQWQDAIDLCFEDIRGHPMIDI